jgi:hypothetical protein
LDIRSEYTDWTITGGGCAFAGSNAYTACGYSHTNAGYTFDPNGGQPVPSTVSISKSFDITSNFHPLVRFGLLADIRVDSQATSINSIPISAQAEVDLGHTIYSSGMRVFNAASQQVVVPLIGQESGLDYSLSFAPAVPEPSEMLMLGTGLALLGGVRRRRGSGQKKS